MLLIYTGNGKGKTSATVGQSIRAHGQGLRVAFAQFMKRPDQAGEQSVLASLLGDNYFAGGRGFFRRESSREEHRQAALSVLAWAAGKVKEADMLVLDETLYALGKELIVRAELEQLLQSADTNGVHVVLSGRGLPDWLREKADLITEMTEIKHHFSTGCSAVKGIEF